MIQLDEDSSLTTSVRGCQVFTFSEEVLTSQVIRYRRKQKWSCVDDTLVSKYGKGYYKEISMINTLVATAKRHGLKGSRISLHEAHYSLANKLTKQGISYTRTKQLLHKMDVDGLITLYVGYWDAKAETGEQSFFIVNPEYEEMWEGVDTSGALARQEEDIVIRDSLSKALLPTRPFRGITLLRQDLNAYNKMLKEHSITVDGDTVDLSYKRVFHDNLKGSGRYYSNNSFQTIKKEHRAEILIDNLPTAELDYSAIHPRILYTLEGINLSKDWKPYDAPAAMEASRDARKIALLIMLFSRDRHSAVWELSKKAEIAVAEAESIVAALEEHNIQIAKHFYQKDLWKALQHYDSRIASEVLALCMARNICVLPYHDSFRVEEGYAEILLGVMFESWRRIMGNTVNCVVERK